MLYSTRTQQIYIDYEIDGEEYYIDEVININITASNAYKIMPGNEFYVTFEQGDSLVKRYSTIDDLGDGTYKIEINITELDIPPGTYSIKVRSKFQTETLNVQILSRFSWGPRYVEIALVFCAVYLLISRFKTDSAKTNKNDIETKTTETNLD